MRQGRSGYLSGRGRCFRCTVFTYVRLPIVDTGPQNVVTGPQNVDTGPQNVDTGPQNVDMGLIRCGYPLRTDGFCVSDARGKTTLPCAKVLECGFPSEICAHCVNSTRAPVIFLRKKLKSAQSTVESSLVIGQKQAQTKQSERGIHSENDQREQVGAHEEQSRLQVCSL